MCLKFNRDNPIWMSNEDKSFLDETSQIMTENVKRLQDAGETEFYGRDVFKGTFLEDLYNNSDRDYIFTMKDGRLINAADTDKEG